MANGAASSWSVQSVSLAAFKFEGAPRSAKEIDLAAGPILFDLLVFQAISGQPEKLVELIGVENEICTPLARPQSRTPSSRSRSSRRRHGPWGVTSSRSRGGYRVVKVVESPGADAVYAKFIRSDTEVAVCASWRASWEPPVPRERRIECLIQLAGEIVGNVEQLRGENRRAGPSETE